MLFLCKSHTVLAHLLERASRKGEHKTEGSNSVRAGCANRGARGVGVMKVEIGLPVIQAGTSRVHYSGIF